MKFMKIIKVFFLILFSCNIYGQDVITEPGSFLYYEIVEVKGISNPKSIVSSVFHIDSILSNSNKDSLISIINDNVLSIKLFVELSKNYEVIYCGSLLKRYEGCLRYDVGNVLLADKIKMIIEKTTRIESIRLKGFLYKRNFYFKIKTQNVYYYVNVLLFSGTMYYVENEYLPQCVLYEPYGYFFNDSTLEILRNISNKKFGFLIGIKID